MMVGSGQPVFVHALPALPVPATPSESGSVIYQNAAYDGGSEFNPGGTTNGIHSVTVSSGVVVVDGIQGPIAENGAGNLNILPQDTAKEQL